MRYLQNEVNLHTHSFYCRHGEGKISEYVKKAEEKVLLKVLGFSEHAPLPDKILYYGTRMDYSDLDRYDRDVKYSWEQSVTGLKTKKGFIEKNSWEKEGTLIFWDQYTLW